MRKFLVALALALTVTAGAYAQLGGFGYGGIVYVVNVGDQTIDDENAIVLIKYVGTSQQATIDVTDTDDIEFWVGDQGSAAAPTDESAADINVGNVCGTVAGELQLDDAECNTVGEMVRVINVNTSDHGWVAVLVGALPSEAIAAVDYIDPADKDCKQEGGCTLVPDSSVHDEVPGLFAPWLNTTIRRSVEGKFSIEPFLTRGFQGSSFQELKGNPVPSNYLPFLQQFLANQDSAAGDTFDVYSFIYDNEDGTPTAKLVYTTALADNTDVNSSVNWLHAPLAGTPGSILFIRLDAATAGTLSDNSTLDFFGFYGRLLSE